jgi:hypothetical protein
LCFDLWSDSISRLKASSRVRIGDAAAIPSPPPNTAVH